MQGGTRALTDIRLDFLELLYPFVIVRTNIKIVFCFCFFDHTKSLNNKHGMMGDYSTTRLRNNMWVGYAFFIADVLNIKDAITGIFIERVISRRMEEGTAAIKIDSKAAANIDIFQIRKAYLF